MRLTTIKLLAISLLIITIVFIAGIFWEILGLGPEQTPILAFILMIAFAINIAGLIFYFSDRKKDAKKALIGLIGHLLLIVIFLYLSISSLLTMT